MLYSDKCYRKNRKIKVAKIPRLGHVFGRLNWRLCTDYSRIAVSKNILIQKESTPNTL